MTSQEQIETQELVKEFLQENVTRHHQPSRVTLSRFRVNWQRFEGSVDVFLDETKLQERVHFSLQASGKVEMQMPMLHSPYGVPASYPSIELTFKTLFAINRLLQSAIPRLKGLGLAEVASSNWITNLTPLSQRVMDADALEQAQEKLADPLFSVSVEV